MQAEKRDVQISEVGESVCPWEANPAAWLLMIRSHVESEKKKKERLSKDLGRRVSTDSKEMEWNEDEESGTY